MPKRGAQQMTVCVEGRRGECFDFPAPYSALDVLTFARIGSQFGSPRKVYIVFCNGRRKLVRRYKKGQATMRGMDIEALKSAMRRSCRHK